MEDNVQQNESRLHWESTQTTTGYKRKKGAGLQAAAAENKLANDLNILCTRFDQRDFCTQQTQAVNGERDQPVRPYVTNEEDVRLNFRNINSKSASGPDDGSGKILKLCSDSLAPVLTELLQRSLSEGYIPKVWKISTIIPVPNKRSSSQTNDYRPVAHISIVFKSVEKIVLNHLRSETAEHQDPCSLPTVGTRSQKMSC